MLEVNTWGSNKRNRREGHVFMKAYDENADLIYSQYKRNDDIACICEVRKDCIEIVEIFAIADKKFLDNT